MSSAHERALYPQEKELIHPLARELSSQNKSKKSKSETSEIVVSKSKESR
jgi:hypothetical protein